MSELTPELESFIAFRLGQLSERNEHHKFEEIATRIARKRISSNILVSNGPVSAGGDQQRDGESYTTRIPDEFPNAAGFAASASTSPVVIACTVQRTGLRAKVLADLEGICGPGAAPVDIVAFFSVSSIPEATSHDLQRIARDQYGVTLDIFSGAKIATLLAEPDLVWIAQHYLEVPAVMVPDPEGVAVPEWYATVLDGLRSNHGPAALTPATQGEITEGIRFATWDAAANSDLPEWADFMSAFLRDELSSDLVFRACYEISVARFRGLGEATDDLVRRAIGIACSSARADILEDCATLVSYWGNMWFAGVSSASAPEIAEARAKLIAHLTAELETTNSSEYPVRAATLTGTMAYLMLTPKVEQAEGGGYSPTKVERDRLAGVSLVDAKVDTSSAAESGLFDLNSVMAYLDQLVDLLPRARAYSVSSIARIFTLFTPALASDPRYTKVRDALDGAVAAVHGDAAIAQRCRDRAIAFVEAGQPLAALGELHDAKVRWFHGDLIYGAVLVTRFIGHLYRDLGLTYAAKMYASAAAMFANLSTDADTKAQLPKALLDSARAAQLAGSWIDAAGLTEVALLAQASLATDPFDIDKYPELGTHELNELMQYLAVRKFWPDLEPLFEAEHPNTGLYEQMVEDASQPGNEMPFDEGAFQELARGQFRGPVLSDLGPNRVIDFAALGVRWVFTFDADRTTVLSAEGFVAAFQVFIADAARYDPVIVEDTVRVHIDVIASGTSVVEPEGDSADMRVTIVSAMADFDELVPFLVAGSMQLLQEVHARPNDELAELLENLMRDGISHKVVVGRPYYEVADFLSTEHYERCAAATRPASSSDFAPTAHVALVASTRLGRGYDRAEALTLIEQRYRAAEAWKVSLASFFADPRGLDRFLQLRGEGWLDWQFIVAFVNVGLNWRLRQSGANIRNLAPAQLRQIAMRPEGNTDSPVPVDVFLREIEVNLAIQTAVIAGTWKLRSRPEKRGEGIMRNLLTRRYRFAVDDVPHRDILACLDGEGRFLPIVE
ncbi:hypothetical protein [Leifsonia soli]|uniref:Phosphoglycolate phosphatase-like HAD superfamily hydrolase n=1 Tax=Leifsonia soli TaxID=582665 RepID=A0A852T266_9MICO|nr:hypothetical protein [Leifsonia soli]NYD75257.1 phosphoglycolate phosphatase-like HAD superfamily hydrolase [Leifsonia soli]